MSDDAKVVVVTGAALGIGAATARLFLEQGARVALLDIRDIDPEVIGPYGGGAYARRADVSDGVQVREAFTDVLDRFGRIDVLVNNAGIQAYGRVLDTSEEEWDRVLDVNLKSAFLCARAALPSMLEQQFGVVINVASVQAFVTQPNVAAYTTSKTALLGLTRSIAVDYAPHVRCVAVCPGTVDTPMLRWSANQSPDPQEVLEEVVEMHPLKRIAQPQEIAKVIAFLSSDDAGFITGQAYRIDGGLGISIGGSIRK